MRGAALVKPQERPRQSCGHFLPSPQRVSKAPRWPLENRRALGSSEGPSTASPPGSGLALETSLKDSIPGRGPCMDNGPGTGRLRDYTGTASTGGARRRNERPR